MTVNQKFPGIQKNRKISPIMRGEISQLKWSKKLYHKIIEFIDKDNKTVNITVFHIFNKLVD